MCCFIIKVSYTHQICIYLKQIFVFTEAKNKCDHKFKYKSLLMS